MTNAVAETVTTNIVPVQAIFDENGVCVGLVGPGGEFFSPPLSSDTITNAIITSSTINSSVIGGVTPAAGTFSTMSTGNAQITGGSISGVSITITALNNTPVGNITPSTGAFTTLNSTDLTVTNLINGSISGNAATATNATNATNAAHATTADTATTATTATNIAGGSTGSVPYQATTNSTSFLAAGSNGQVLTLASGVPSWATPTTGTVTSIATSGTVSGITLTGGPITSSGTITLGGILDLSSPPAIGGATPNTGRFTLGLVGTNASFTDFPNAQFIGSHADTGDSHIYNIGVAGEAVATDVAGGGQWGVGVYGVGATAGATRGIGLVGDGRAGNTADTAAAIGVRGYSTGTHSGGQNIGLYAQATGGASNYALFMASGNIYSAVDQTWAVNDDSTSALSIDATGKAGIFKVITSNGAEGISTSGSLVVTNAFGVGSSPSYGTSGQVLTSAGTGAAPTWTTPTAYATVTDDTTTNATRYPLFAAATSGNLTTEYTSSTKYQFNPSTGVLTATQFSGSGAGLTSIPNSALTNSSVTIGSTSVSLGATVTTFAGLVSVTSTTFVGALTGNASTATSATSATNATNVGITDDTTTNATVYPSWVTSTTGNLPVKTSSTKLKFNPSTGALTASQLIIAP